jgi:hypothetical protein
MFTRIWQSAIGLMLMVIQTEARNKSTNENAPRRVK